MLATNNPASNGNSAGVASSNPTAMSVRDQKKQQIKFQQNKREAKDTRTKSTYLECLKEVEQENERIMSEYKRIMPKEETQTIKNIFKMSRVQVDNDKSIKDKMMKDLVLKKGSKKSASKVQKSNKNDLGLDTNTSKTQMNENLGSVLKMSSINRGNTSESGDRILKNPLVKKAADSQKFGGNEFSESQSDMDKDSVVEDQDDLAGMLSDDEKNYAQFGKSKQQFKLMEIPFPPNMVKAQGVNRLRWDFIIIFLAVYQGITIPIAISFNPDRLNSPFYKTLDSLIDLVFLLDIVLNFRTTYIDSVTGEEVLDPQLIGYKYLTDMRFMIDVLSTIPLDDYFESSGLQFLGILKILRLQRINNVILNLNTSQETKAAYKVIYLIFQMFMFIHIMGCVWYVVVSEQEIWIPNMDFIFYGTPQIYDYYYNDWVRSYITSLYLAFYLFGVGEVCPRTQIELITAICVLITSSILNGLIIGNMALYMNELNKKNAEFQRKLDTVNTAMKALNINKDLRREVTEFFQTTNATQVLQTELRDFMRKRISQTYRVLCSIYIFKDTVRTNPITKQLLKSEQAGKKSIESKQHDTEVIENIIKRMKTVLQTPEQKLVVQGDEIIQNSPQDQMYFLAKGSCNVLIKDKFDDRFEEKLVGTITPGMHFGEIGLLYGCPRSATVISSNYCTCSSINRTEYNELLILYPDLNKLIRQQIQHYKDPLKVFIEMSLNEISFFQKLPRHIKNEFLFSMKLKTFEKGSFLYKRDDESKEMYLIQSGMVEIFNYMDKKEESEFVIERLYRGSIVNHNSFLMNDELDTDARCTSTVTVYYIDIDTFKTLRSKHIELDQIMDTHEAWLVGGNRREPAIDYIVQSPYSHQYFKVHSDSGELIHDYKKEMHRKKLTVQLKNAIMVVWLDVKKERNKPNLEDIIKNLQAKSQAIKGDKQQTTEDLKQLRKQKRENERKEALEKAQEEQKHLSSYLNRQQFQYFFENLMTMNTAMSEQNILVDEIETNLISINKKRNQRREQKNQDMVQMFKEIAERKKREKYLETLKLASFLQAEGDGISPDAMDAYRSGIQPQVLMSSQEESLSSSVLQAQPTSALNLLKEMSKKNSSKQVNQASEEPSKSNNQLGLANIIEENDEHSSESHSLKSSQKVPSSSGGYHKQLKDKTDPTSQFYKAFKLNNDQVIDKQK